MTSAVEKALLNKSRNKHTVLVSYRNKELLTSEARRATQKEREREVEGQ
jgi:hypothetical protein